ncbi:sugar-binding domain-containing protein [Mucilaginibacter litoreus]|uniref:Sugar-binding domain-containing protein n=1 Tax=Mucilaginibacter litoreus TaxID=1048221 RepID=A0ABW3AM42_9SPHI
MNLSKKSLMLGALCAYASVTYAQTYKQGEVPIPTRWAKVVSPTNALKEYPRPQLVRTNWTNLNGLWSYAITAKDELPTAYSGSILVPYPIESALSGVKKNLQPNQSLWYKRAIVKPNLKAGERVILHFGAVDFEATVYLNGKEITKHQGGYTEFSVDVTDELKSGSNELGVKVWDPTNEGFGPSGKQVLHPENIYYTPSSGIWQTVWMEVVPADHVTSLKIKPDVDHSSVKITVNSNTNVSVSITGAGKTIKGKANSEISLPVTNAHLWSPDDPYLYNLTVKLGSDQIKSYFGMRKIEIKKDKDGIDKIFLNNKFTYNLGTLDQGFWPDGLYTAPTDEALKFDIQAIKAMGFNTIRKHIKVEPARWYYWTDKLGMLVWQDIVNPNQGLPAGAKEEFEKEAKATVVQLYNSPSIVTWVLFNERWGQYDQARLTTWLKQLDPSRIVNGHTGEYLYVNHQLRQPSEQPYINSDIADVHAYPNPMMPMKLPNKALVVGEFGGIGVPVEKHMWDEMKGGWGYDGTKGPLQMQVQYAEMADSLRQLEKLGLTGSIYTQPFDVETELNGLMTYDREIIKLPAAIIRNINSKVWPATKNWPTATKGFSATVADTSDHGYATKLKLYQAGSRDPQLLRELTLMAFNQNDGERAKQLAHEYLQSLKEPVSVTDLRFIFQFTLNSQGQGYPFLVAHVDQLLKVVDSTTVSRKFQKIVFDEMVQPVLTQSPDYEKIDQIIREHPEVSTGEFIIGLSVFKYLQAIAEHEQNALDNFMRFADIYDSRFPGLATYNDWAWAVFQNSDNQKYLEQALSWSKKSLQQSAEADKAGVMDTYANLLYKLGKKQEALEWEAKALAASNGNAEIKANYEKMQKGEKTW